MYDVMSSQFFQACQGQKVMRPYIEAGTQMEAEFAQGIHLPYKIIPQFADFLIYSSTYPGA